MVKKAAAPRRPAKKAAAPRVRAPPATKAAAPAAEPAPPVAEAAPPTARGPAHGRRRRHAGTRAVARRRGGRRSPARGRPDRQHAAVPVADAASWRPTRPRRSPSRPAAADLAPAMADRPGAADLAPPVADAAAGADLAPPVADAARLRPTRPRRSPTGPRRSADARPAMAGEVPPVHSRWRHAEAIDIWQEISSSFELKLTCAIDRTGVRLRCAGGTGRGDREAADTARRSVVVAGLGVAGPARRADRGGGGRVRCGAAVGYRLGDIYDGVVAGQGVHDVECGPSSGIDGRSVAQVAGDGGCLSGRDVVQGPGRGDPGQARRRHHRCLRRGRGRAGSPSGPVGPVRVFPGHGPVGGSGRGAQGVIRPRAFAAPVGHVGRAPRPRGTPRRRGRGHRGRGPGAWPPSTIPIEPRPSVGAMPWST